MKKSIFTALSVLFVIAIAGSALAKTALLPKGKKVCVTVHENGTATIVPPAGYLVEFYAYEEVRNFPAGTVTIDLREGRRFQVIDSNGVYALLTPEMAKNPPDFFGPGTGEDCSNSRGCCFLITGN